MKKLIGLLCLSLCSIANITYAENAPHTPAQLQYTLIAERSHKPSLFTQGLFIKDKVFYESSGLYGKSAWVSYPVAEPASTWAKMTAPFLHRQPLPEQYFAEGMALLNNKIYQITWREGTVLVFDATSFANLPPLYYQGEGWGLTADGQHLIRSDGSDQLFFHQADDFKLVSSLHVTRGQQPLRNINELEYIDGFIWANVWHDNHIFKINPHTGEVVGELDMGKIAESLHLTDSESVLNGIAYDADAKAFWITGKQWPKMFLIKIH